MNRSLTKAFGIFGIGAVMLLSRGAYAQDAKPGEDLKKPPDVTEQSIGVDSLSGKQNEAASVDQEFTTKEVKGSVQLTTAQRIAAIDIPWEDQRGKNLTSKGVKTIAKMDSMQTGGLVMVYYANGDKSEGVDSWEDGYDPEDATVYAEAETAMRQLKYKYKDLQVDKITLTDSFDGEDNIEVYYKGARLFTQPSVTPVRGSLTNVLVEATEENLEKFKKWQQGQVSGVSTGNTLTLASNN